MRLEDSSWKRFVARALVLSAMIFGAVRLAVADPGGAGGAARSYVTVAGTLTGVTGTATARFRFYDARTAGTLLCESSAMVGNLWELTDEWYAGLSGSGTDGRTDWPSDYGGDGPWNLTPSVHNRPGSTRNFAIPAVAERGGAWPSGTTAGRFALLLVDGPSNWTGGVGFRCVIPR